MDATYKTNKHHFPLLIITGVTALNTSFYVGFAFMRAEYTSDYEWVSQPSTSVADMAPSLAAMTITKPVQRDVYLVKGTHWDRQWA